MALWIVTSQEDDVTPGFWHFKIAGDAADDKIRLADTSQTTTSPEDWLAANQATAQSMVDSGYYDEDYEREYKREQAVAEAKAWYAANPDAKVIFTDDVPTIETKISNLVEGLFPSATANQKANEKLLRVGLIVNDRAFARGLGFLD